MKTKFFLTGVFFMIVINSFSQGISKIKPVVLNWKSNNENVTLKKASTDGITQPDSLSFEIVFDKNELARFSAAEYNFEFKWYYYLSTRKKLMDSYIITCSVADVTDEGSIIIKSTKTNINKGWWEVQIIAQHDNGLIELGNLSQFQIFVK